MTFEVKLLITFVATHPLVILTKFGQNRMKHVEEEANCEKKEELDIRLCHLDDIDPAAGFFRTPQWPKIDLWPQGIDRVRVFSWCMVLAIMIMVCKIDDTDL